MAQLGGEFTDELRAVLATCSSSSVLQDCESELEPLPDCEVNDPRVAAEDEWASLLGGIGLKLAALRVRRRLFLSGWPHRWALALSSGERASLIQAFKLDREAWEALRSLNPRPADVEKHLRRHQFGCTNVQQFLAGMKVCGWRWCDRFGAMVDEHFTTNVGAACRKHLVHMFGLWVWG